MFPSCVGVSDGSAGVFGFRVEIVAEVFWELGREHIYKFGTYFYQDCASTCDLWQARCYITRSLNMGFNVVWP